MRLTEKIEKGTRRQHGNLNRITLCTCADQMVTISIWDIRSHILVIPMWRRVSMRRRSRPPKKKQLMRKEENNAKRNVSERQWAYAMHSWNSDCQLVTHHSFSITYPQTKSLQNILNPSLITTAALILFQSENNLWIAPCQIIASWP